MAWPSSAQPTGSPAVILINSPSKPTVVSRPRCKPRSRQSSRSWARRRVRGAARGWSITPIVYIHSIVTTSTGWERPFRVTDGAEPGNRVAHSLQCSRWQDSPTAGKTSDSSGLVDSSTGEVNGAGGSFSLV